MLPTSLSLQDLITAPAKAESLLEQLTADQLLAIERTLGKVKRRRLDKKESTPPPVIKPTTVKSTPPSTLNEPVTEIRDGVEWVSFVYSHNRTLKRYSIRTDLQEVDLEVIDDKFKNENCVYPRANLPKEEYHGNRWAYETECNVLGWKLAWLNKEEIAGKRGLIQRAVDSYRNRYPSMRSRRVARQEKLLNGTLRKRKQREGEESADVTTDHISIQSTHHPKTIAIEDTVNHQRFRIKINVESVDLEEINIEFRKANCPYPRVMNTPKPTTNNTRWTEETMCNELAWKMAWLNPRHLAGKKNMLQRALDIYRSKFMPSLQPRKNSNRIAPIPPPNLLHNEQPLMHLLTPSMPLTVHALSAQNALYEKTITKSVTTASPTLSSGTTESLDFGDCFSLADEDDKKDAAAEAAAFCDILLQEPLFMEESRMTYSSDESSSTASPTSDPFTTDFFDQFMMPSSFMDDPFYMMDNNSSNTAVDLSKLYNTNLDDTFAGNLLDPLF